MKVEEIMTAEAEIRFIGPDTSVTEAARLLRDLDVGALPICDQGRLIGMVTDRDIVVRAVADGTAHNLAVSDIMSTGVMHAEPDQDVIEAAQLMEARQVRRLPVLDRARHLVGIVALGDLALESKPAVTGHALKEISRPRAGFAAETVRSIPATQRS